MTDSGPSSERDGVRHVDRNTPLDLSDLERVKVLSLEMLAFARRDDWDTVKAINQRRNHLLETAIPDELFSEQADPLRLLLEELALINAELVALADRASRDLAATRRVLMSRVN